MLAVLAMTATSVAEPKWTPPCAGCVLDVPAARDKPPPLLVVLHGDRERATTAIEKWRGAAHAKGWALLALQCPASEGCKDSWWQWNGDPAWVAAQVDAVAKQVAIDRTRVALAGWSGGGSYIGQRARAWHAWFAAVVVHGGGIPSIDAECSARPLPAYFLVGDKNPLHHLAVKLKSYLEDCKQPVVWDLVKGGDHDREDRALDAKKSRAILDWLYARPRT
jgi:poly(3-hydroxybutyrate) depolymerase